MNIKSLLLGSAAALLAVSGARAADAVEVAAEPENVEYVRVCDTYGTGYFYIPGTETCLRIGGYVRYDIGAGDGAYGGRNVRDLQNNPNGDADGDWNQSYHKRARLALRTYTGTETELGTLKTFTETRFQYQDGNHGGGTQASLNFAWIQLGGFRVGRDDSAFLSFSGYAGNVIGDDIIAYGLYDTNLISYTFDGGNGFSAIVSLETGANNSIYEIDSYVPHVVAGVKYAGGWGSASLTGAYDSTVEQFAVKGRVDVNVNDQLSLFAMGAWGSTDDDLGVIGNFSTYKTWAGDWAIWAGATYKFSDKASFNVQGSYTDGGDFIEDGQWAVAANVRYEVVKDFFITPEVTYSDLGVDDTSNVDADGFGGWLRFQRNF